MQDWQQPGFKDRGEIYFRRVGESSPGEIRYTSPGYGNVVGDTYRMPTDGWIVRAAVFAGGREESVRGQMAIWNAGGSLIYRAPYQDFPSGASWKTMEIPPEHIIGRSKDAGIMVGFWTELHTAREWSVVGNKPAYYVTTHPQNFPQAPQDFDDITAVGGELVAYFEYIQNQAPRPPVFSGDSPEGQVTETSVKFDLEIPHDWREDGNDHTTAVHVRVFDRTNGRMIYDRVVGTTKGQTSSGTWSTDNIDLPAGRQYYAEARHQDSFGRWGGFSDRLFFQVNQGPGKPEGGGVSGKLDVAGPPDFPAFTATYAPKAGVAVKRAKIEVFNRARTSKLYDTGFTPISDTGSYSRTLAQVIGEGASLPWGTQFSWRTQVQDEFNVTSPYSDWIDFNTNAKPHVPADLSPASGSASASKVFSCSLSDPDGDRVQRVQIEVRNSAGAVLAGYPADMTIADDGRSATFDAGTTIALGNAYRYRVRASDGVLWGGWTDITDFVHQSAPEVTPLFPTPATVYNLVENPRPTFEDTEGYWTDLGVNAENTITAPSDGDAAFGDVSWLATCSANSGLRRQGKPVRIEPDTPYLFRVYLKKKDELSVSSTLVSLLLYDAAGTYLGARLPDSVRGAQNSDIPSYWTMFGGVVGANSTVGATVAQKFPANAVTFVPEVYFSNNSKSLIGFDAFQVTPMPKGLSYAELVEAQKFFGFFDGSEQGYGPPQPTGYSWAGEPGAATSAGENILDTANPTVTVSYTHPENKARTAERLIIERFDGAGYVAHRDTGWMAPASGVPGKVAIPVPAGAMSSENRYRLQVLCRDSAGIVGSTSKFYLDVRYEGPPELNILNATTDDRSATVTVEFEQTNLGPTEFGGIEFAVEEGAAAPVVHDLVTNPNSTSYTYHFPVSGREVNYCVRQVRNVEGGVVQSRWQRARLTSDYFPYFFLKSVEYPATQSVKFEPVRGSLPGRKPNVNSVSEFTWGNRRPVHKVGDARWSTGEVTVELHGQDSEIERSPDEDLATLEAMEDSRGVVCILRHVPAERRFVHLSDIAYELTDSIDHSVPIGWEETDYAFDYYEREVDER